ncbi:MAG: aldo/keto reductase, partial [Oligosphaeraceae bacterium]|nr:aldo/keto reductase [Oligosphaeraceae bacterium]
TKMPVRTLTSAADAERIFNEQLTKCKTDYFDFYLMHFLNRDTWQNATRCKVYDFLRRQQSEGKIGKIGFSFHDTPEVLETIARAHPWDFAQIQLNYLDWTIYRSKEQYEILTRLGIPVIVMEPLRGGTLGSLNPDAMAILQQAQPQASAASWAFRFAAGLPNVMTVLSGMTYTEHLEDNIRTFTPLMPLNEAEREVLAAALLAYRKGLAVPCTACQYCLPCPVGVQIPRLFGLYNQYKNSGNFFHFNLAYGNFSEKENAAACIACGACLKKCPQKINIPEELRKVAAEIASGNKK